MSSASDNLHRGVRVGWRIPRSIWLTNVRSTLALKASASCDMPRVLRCSRSTCPNSVGMWSAMVAYGPGACGYGSTGYTLPEGARPHCGAAFAVRSGRARPGCGNEIPADSRHLSESTVIDSPLPRRTSMPSGAETTNLALFCDFENIALGVRDARYEKFDITRVLERLLLKGSIVVKKAYCDWERYKEFKSAMHHAGFELIEIPHVKVSGKNSADIRMVVDALDLCYTKPHVDTFVIISGDSDFSPLVSKLRENNKGVIGVGVKNSTSDLLIANCDEFIYYDDLVRAKRKAPAKKRASKGAAGATAAEALELAIETIEALVAERGDEETIWGSMVKQALRRRKPGFNETFYGYRSFNELLEDAARHGMLMLERDDKSGGYRVRLAPAE